MAELNFNSEFLDQIKKAIETGLNAVKIGGNSGLWLVKADTPEAKEREDSKEALIVYSKVIDEKKYFICRR